MFYAAVNNTNSSGTNDGDMIYLTNHTVIEFSVGLAELFDQSISNIYPNPAIDYVNIDLPANADVRIFDNSGRQVMTTTVSSEKFQINVSGYERGIYYLQVQKDGQVATRSFVRR